MVCISTDASFSSENKTAGLGGVLVDSAGDCAAWFSIRLNEDQCNLLGADSKDTIIYELELLAACMAMEMWDLFLRHHIQFVMVTMTASALLLSVALHKEP